MRRYVCPPPYKFLRLEYVAGQLYNLEKDINITDKQFLIALTVFFFPYALFEVSHQIYFP